MTTNVSNAATTILIDSIDKFHDYISPILEQIQVAAIDCEGSPDLSKTGTICVIQLCCCCCSDRTEDNEQIFAFIIDALTEGIVPLLKPLLESRSVLKVIHDGRRDAEALFHQFGISLSHVLDTQIAHKMILMSDLQDSAFEVLDKVPKKLQQQQLQQHLYPKTILSQIFGYLVQVASDHATFNSTQSAKYVSYIHSLITADFIQDHDNIVALAQLICDVAISSYIEISRTENQQDNHLTKFCAHLCLSLITQLKSLPKISNFKQSFKNAINEVNENTFSRLIEFNIHEKTTAPSTNTEQFPIFSKFSAEQAANNFQRITLHKHAVFTTLLYLYSVLTEKELTSYVSALSTKKYIYQSEFDKALMIPDYAESMIKVTSLKLRVSKMEKILDDVPNWKIPIISSIVDVLIPKDDLESDGFILQESNEMNRDPSPYRIMLYDISLVKMLSQYSGLDYSEKIGHRNGAREDPMYWKLRPLPADMVDIAGKDVINLIPLYEAIRVLTIADRYRNASRHTVLNHLPELIIQKSELYLQTIRTYGYTEDLPQHASLPQSIYDGQFVIHEEELPEELRSLTNFQLDQTLTILDVKNKSMGKIIGKQGRNIQQLIIQFPFATIFTFKTVADRLFIIATREETRNIVSAMPKDCIMTVTRQQLGCIMGNNGKRLLGIEQQSGCTILVRNEDEDLRRIRIMGSDDQIAAAQHIIHKYLEKK